MEEKLSWTELRRVVATRANVNAKQANAFFNALQAQLVEALKRDKLVRVNGLGTFKVQPVAPRKSVNVTTGEEIIIEGYNKVVFVPEAGLKELVEKETIDPLKKLGAQAEEIVDILGELGQSPKGEETPKPEEPEKTEEPKVVEPKVEEPEVEEPEPVIVTKAPKKQYHFVRDTLICVVILLLLLLVGYFFFRHQITGWIEDMMKDQPAKTELVTTVPETSPAPELTVHEEEPVPEWTYSELLLTEEITPGSRLAWIAKKHYGDKIYWPYLYAANKDRLTNPSHITIGTPIRVPKLTPADRDTTSAQFEKIRQEAQQALQDNW